MLRTIKVTNFRGFRSLDVNLERISIAMGPNSSGKTTLLQAVQIGLTALDMALQSNESARILEQLGNKEISVCRDLLIPDHTQLLPLDDWASLFLNRNTEIDSAFEIKLIFDKEDQIRSITSKIKCARNNQIKLEVWIDAPRAVDSVKGLSKQSPQVNKTLYEFITNNKPQAVLIPSFYGVIKDEEYRAKPILERAVRAGTQAQVVRNLLYRLDDDAWSRLNTFLLRYINTEIVNKKISIDQQAYLKYYFKDTNGELELICAGAGLINLIALYASLERHRLGRSRSNAPLIFLLDEPEAHLHPRLQGEAVEAISQLVIDAEAQVIMATHSVELINRTRYMNQASLLRINRNEQVASTLSTSAEFLRELVSWADLTPFAALNFLASRKILFHEGATDAPLLDTCARLLFMDNPRRQHIYESWTKRPLGGTGKVELVKTWHQLLRTGWLPESTAEAPLDVVVVLDKDHTRQPTTAQQTSSDEVNLRQHIWPLHSIESLFCEVEVLPHWIKAYLDVLHGQLRAEDQDATQLRNNIFPQIQTLVTNAILAANGDESLQADAIIQQTTAQLLSRQTQNPQEYTDIQRDARHKVTSAPAEYQRGKDRARFILGHLRDALRSSWPRLVNAFTTDLPQLVERAQRSHYLNATAVPRAIAVLLNELAP